MKKLELNDILSILTFKEFKHFGDYIRSPFFNVPERVAALYGFIENNYKAVMSGNFGRGEIADKVLSGSRTPENIRKLFSDFNKETEKFLSLTEFENDRDYQMLALLRRLRSKENSGETANQRENFSRLAQKLNDAEKEISPMSPDASYYLKALNVFGEKSLSEPVSGFHKYSPALQNESDMLDAFYMSSKLLKFQIMFSKQQLNKQPLGYRWDMYEEITGFIEKNNDRIKEKFPDVYTRFLMTKMAVSRDDGLINECASYLYSLDGRMANEQLADFYSDLYNYITIRIGEGKHELREAQLNLFKHLDDKNLLYDVPPGKIHAYTYKQAADTAFHMKDFLWAEHFLKKYSGAIDSLNSKDIINLLNAKLHYYKNDSQKARVSLARVDYNDYIHYLDAKMFLLCIEYDAENFIEAGLIIDSLNKYLKSHTDIPESSADNSKSFLYYAKTLLNMKETGCDSFMHEKLAEALVRDERPIYARKWLIEKLDEMQTV